MRLRRSLALLTLLVIVSTGCVRQISSGVIDRGTDGNFVSVKTLSIYGGRQKSLRAAYKEAREYCQQQHKELTGIDEKTGPITVDLTFKCTNSHDNGAVQSVN